MKEEGKIKLKKYRDDIQPILEEFLNSKVKEYEHFSPFAKLFLEHLSEFTLRGGKRLRPALMYYGYKTFSEENLEEVKKISIYLELIQSFLLIHDDIMDRALTRRDGKTIHKIFENYSEKNSYKDDVHFGNTMGILNGDLACLLAYEIINGADIDAESKSELSKLVSKEISKVIFGQIEDVLLTYKKQYDQEDILKVHRYKTAVYTFKLPVFSGAILAKASEKDLKILDDFSIACGIAFQIRDDILGVFGDDETIGKGTTSDISEGKKTLLVSYAYSIGDKRQREILDNFLGKKNLTENEVKNFKQIIEQTGSLTYSQKECERYIKKAKDSLKKLNVEKNEGTDFLNSIADYLLDRKY